MQPIQYLPTEVGPAGDIARHLAIIIGPAYTPADGTKTAADFLALGGALAGARNTNRAALDEAFVTTATYLLSELEVSYGLTARPDLSVADRRTRIIAKIRAARAGSPQGILRAIRTYDPTATLIEVTPDDISPRTSDGVNPGTDRDVYAIGIVLAPDVWADTSKRAEIVAIVQQMKPAHIQANIAVTVPFLTDDTDSLTDRDLLGT